MFGMGFTEILFIAIIAIIFLGPDKLPTAMVQIAKTLNSFKKSITEVRSTIETEMNMHDLREDALSYKRIITDDISGFKNAMVETTQSLNEALVDEELIEEDEENYDDIEPQKIPKKKLDKKSNKTKEPKDTAKKAKKKSKSKKQKTEKKKSDSTRVSK